MPVENIAKTDTVFICLEDDVFIFTFQNKILQIFFGIVLEQRKLSNDQSTKPR